MNKEASERKISAADVAALVIRLALGVIFVAHGSQKVLGLFGGPGMGAVIGMIGKLGFSPPWFWGWLMALAEFLGGLGVLFGALTRLAALGIMINMLVAVAKIHFKNGFFAPMGFEYNLALIAMALSLIIAGAGRLSIDWLVRQWQKNRAWDFRKDRRGG